MRVKRETAISRVEIFPDRSLHVFLKTTMSRDGNIIGVQTKKEVLSPGDPIGDPFLALITKGLWTASEQVKAHAFPKPKPTRELYTAHRGADQRVMASPVQGLWTAPDTSESFSTTPPASNHGPMYAVRKKS